MFAVGDGLTFCLGGNGATSDVERGTLNGAERRPDVKSAPGTSSGACQALAAKEDPDMEPGAACAYNGDVGVGELVLSSA